MASDICSAALPSPEGVSWATDLRQGFHSSVFMLMYSALGSIPQIPTLLNVSIGGS